MLLGDDFMNRMKEIREQKNLSMKEAANGIGIKYTTYIGYEKMEREPNSELLIQIASFFHVTVDYLICRVDYNNYSGFQLSTEDNEVINMYRRLDRDDRGEIRGTMKQMLKAEKYKQEETNVS